MKLLLMLALAGMAQGAAQPVLDLTPDGDKQAVLQSGLWIDGGRPEATNLGCEKAVDSFSGKVLRLLTAATKEKEFFANYRFTIRTGGVYIFYAALIRQGMPYASPVEFRFDRGAWTPVAVVNQVRPSWGISRAITWEALGEHQLAPGKHTVEFRFGQRAPNGNWSFMCDGILGLTRDGIKKFKLADFHAPGAAMPGQRLPFEFTAVGTNAVLAEAALVLGADKAASRIFMLRPGRQQLTLQLPPLIGANRYELEIRSPGSSERVIGRKSIDIGAAPLTPSAPLELRDAAVAGMRYKIELAGNSGTGRILAMLFVGSQLRAVDVIVPVAGQTEASGELSAELRRAAAGQEGRVVFVAAPGLADNRISVRLAPSAPAAAISGKPLAYGFFQDRYRIVHPWYMDRQFRYIFDGTPYVPFGGMWCPGFLGGGRGEKAALAHDRTVLKNLLAAGLNDVYLNMASGAPAPVKQYFVDLLERSGVNYGYQLSSGGGQNIPAFFITRDREKASGQWQGLLRGEYRAGAVTVEMAKTYRVAGLLIFPDTEPPTWCRLATFQDLEGKNTRNQIIDLEQAQDFKAVRTIRFKIKLPLSDGARLIVTPLLDANMAHANLWDPQRRAETMARLAWVGKIKWGPHLRLLLDPVCNETNMVNTTENLRQYTPAINAAFAGWLKTKYGTVAKLEQAWQIGAVDFAAAGRLIPLRLGTALLLADPESGKVYFSSLSRSAAWLDYNAMIRETYGDYYDEIARYLKSMVDVPIINKSVGAHGSPEHVSRGYPGWDGTGFEIYGGEGLPIGSGGASLAEAHASAHTMWKVGTEIGHNAQIGNGGTKFFKNEAELRATADNLARLGVSGFYFFGVDLQPSNLWGKHSFWDFPEGLQWIGRLKQAYRNGQAPASVEPSYVYPGGYGWWWWTTRNKALYDYEQNRIPLTVRLTGHEWACNTNVLPPDGKRVIVSCPRPPFSRYHAAAIEQLISSGRQVIYLGERDDPGTIKGLDEFFTDRMIRFADGSTAQALRRLPGTTVLAEEKGQIWALRHGNLTVVSRAPVKDADGDQNRDTGFKYLRPEWLR